MVDLGGMKKGTSLIFERKGQGEEKGIGRIVE